LRAVVLLPIALFAWHACAGADPQVALDEARAAVARGDRTGAIAHLERAVNEDPELAIAHRWLSRFYAQKGLWEKALDSAAAALLLDPEPGDREHLDSLLDAGFPESVARRTPDAFPFPAVRMMIEAGDDRLAASAGPWEALFFAPRDREAPAAAPKFGWKFDRACHGYVLRPGAQRWRLRFVVHYSSAGGVERGELAARCVGLLLRAACLRRAHLGAVGLRRDPVHVWLGDGGEPGGESWGANIYLGDAAAPRGPGEWVRQIIHEYGHAALPGVGHFVQPEPWASGRLGEHLLSRWLQRGRGRGAARPLGPPRRPDKSGLAIEHPWLAAADLDSPVADADRCVSLFLRSGPASPLIADRSAAGMDYYLGLANYIERAFGGKVLAQAMSLTAGTTCEAFAVGVQEALRRASLAGVELRALPAPATAGLGHWTYLPAGRWRAAGRGCGAESTFNGYRLGPDECDIGLVAAGWHSMALPPGAAVTFRPAMNR